VESEYNLKVILSQKTYLNKSERSFHLKFSITIFSSRSYIIPNSVSNYEQSLKIGMLIVVRLCFWSYIRHIESTILIFVLSQILIYSIIKLFHWPSFMKIERAIDKKG